MGGGKHLPFSVEKDVRLHSLLTYLFCQEKMWCVLLNFTLPIDEQFEAVAVAP